MIDAKELIIGNYVQFLGNVVQVEGISSLPERKDMHWVHTPDSPPQKIFHFKPIPLTQEWLEKFGFDKHEEGWWYWKIWGENGVEIIKWAEPYQKFAYELGSHRTKILDYVHQLQNLSFAITGEELTIKQ